MGFTPLDGLMMTTRSGSVDPGLVLWLQLHAGLTAEEICDGLEHQSGLTGLAGTPDMRAVLERSEAGEEEVALAIGVYLPRPVAGIAAMAASAGGVTPSSSAAASASGHPSTTGLGSSTWRSRRPLLPSAGRAC